MAPRDSQKSKVYAGERVAFGDVPFKGMSIAQCQEYVDQITRTAWWRRRCSVGRVSVSAGRGGGTAYYNEITLGTWARQRWVVLHELAHVMTPSGVPGHGPQYCANYVALTRQFLGKEQGDKLQVCLRAEGAKVRGAIRPRNLKKVGCAQCHKPITTGTGWRMGTAVSAQFCTKRCAVAWCEARITRA